MELIIHVGYRKTATTWMQEVLFPQLPVNYIAKTDLNYPRWLIEWHYADDFLFERIKGSIRHELQKRLLDDRPNLISSEAFTNTAVIFSQAERIRQIHPEAKILVTLRDPIAMTWSHYCNDVQLGDCHVKIDHWLDWERTPFVINKRKAIYLPDFFFDEAIAHYRQLFGKDNVCVLRMEDMRDDSGRFFQKLNGFLGVNHPSPSKALLSVKRNQSSSENGLRQRKFETFVEYMKTHFSDFYQLVKDEAAGYAESIGGNSDDIPPDLYQQLQEFFKGRCYGYH